MDGHMEGKKHIGRTTHPMYTLNGMGYPFMEWLQNDPTSAGTSGTEAAPSPTRLEPDHDATVVNGDGTFENKNLGILQVLSGMPAWRVFRKEADADWCLLCDTAASGGNGHIESKTHLAKEAVPDIG